MTFLRARSNLPAVLESLEKLGYQCQAVRMKASNYGLPQRRSRYYIIGVQQDGFAEASSLLVKRICDYMTKMQTPKMVKLVQSPVLVNGLQYSNINSWFWTLDTKPRLLTLTLTLKVEVTVEV